jgi:polyphosphate kinase 2 (PPK2 family)
MGFIDEHQHKHFLEICPTAERYIVDSGITLIKIWLEVGQEEQERRFNARINDSLRQWKLSPMDLESYRRWYAYSRARLDAQSNGYQARALAHRANRRQAAGKAELHFTHPCSNPIQENCEG